MNHLDINGNPKIILDLAGGTGAWSDPYRRAGYDVRLITLPDNDVCDYEPPDNVYGILAAPPCTEFSFAKSNSKYPRDMRKGMETVQSCLRIIWQCQYDLPTPLAKKTNLVFWALENSFGLLRRFLGHAVLVFNPFDFGDPHQKKTCLWGFFNEPKKNPVAYSKDYIHAMYPSGKSKSISHKFGIKADRLEQIDLYNPMFNPDGVVVPPGMDVRSVRRSITPPGFANAFFNANQ